MGKNDVNYKNGVGFLPLLGLLFIGLKLGEIGVVATWSWIWVLSPFWIPLAIVLAIFLIAGVLVGLGKIFK